MTITGHSLSNDFFSVLIKSGSSVMTNSKLLWLGEELVVILAKFTLGPEIEKKKWLGSFDSRGNNTKIR